MGKSVKSFSQRGKVKEPDWTHEDDIRGENEEEREEREGNTRNRR